MSRYAYLQIILIAIELIMFAIVHSPRRSALEVQVFFLSTGLLLGIAICKLIGFYG